MAAHYQPRDVEQFFVLDVFGRITQYEDADDAWAALDEIFERTGTMGTVFSRRFITTELQEVQR